MDKVEALQVLTAQLASLRGLSDEQLVERLLDREETLEVVGPSGKRYQLELLAGPTPRCPFVRPGGSALERDEEGAQRPHDRRSLLGAQGGEHVLLVRQVRHDDLVDELVGLRRELDEHRSPIGRAGYAPDEPEPLQTVDPLRHPPARDHRRPAQRRRSEAERLTGPAQRGEDVVVRPGQPVAGEDDVLPAFGEAPGPDETPEDLDRRVVEVGSLAPPLLDDGVHGI